MLGSGDTTAADERHHVAQPFLDQQRVRLHRQVAHETAIAAAVVVCDKVEDAHAGGNRRQQRLAPARLEREPLANDGVGERKRGGGVVQDFDHARCRRQRRELRDAQLRDDRRRSGDRLTHQRQRQERQRFELLGGVR